MNTKVENIVPCFSFPVSIHSWSGAGSFQTLKRRLNKTGNTRQHRGSRDRKDHPSGELRVLPNPSTLEPHDPIPETKKPVKEGLYSSILDTDEKTDQD